MSSGGEAAIRIVVERVRVEGRGAVLLTGPSSCGKGEVAKAIRSFLSLSEAQHVSMGDVLRRTIRAARADDRFRRRLGEEFGISADVSIFDPGRNPRELIDKVRRYEGRVGRGSDAGGVSQLDWLDFCVNQGLLIPDDWTERIIDAHFDATPGLRDGIFILDGYPRTTVAAQRLLRTFGRLDIGVTKVVHLSITKEQMKLRAANRSRGDDTDEALESRYQFYIEKVQPCIDFLKRELGPGKVSLIDARLAEIRD